MNSTMKSLFVGGIVGCLLVVACETRKGETTDGSQTTSSEEIAEKSNDAKFDGNKEDNADFILEAAKINLSEIKLAKLAVKRATNSEVKEIAQMMIDHHAKLYDETAALAKKKGVSIPDTIDRADIDGYNDLFDKDGADFDKKYVDLNIDAHQKAIEKFEAANSSDKKDDDVKTLANGALPQIRSHVDKLIKLQAKFDNKKI